MISVRGRIERLDAIPHHQRHLWRPLRGGTWTGHLVPISNICLPASNGFDTEDAIERKTRTMQEHYDVNRLFIERPDLYDRTKLPKGHRDRLTLPAAKKLASAQHGIIARLEAERRQRWGTPTPAAAAAIIADRYIARVAA
jgi:hypothetical protein